MDRKMQLERSRGCLRYRSSSSEFALCSMFEGWGFFGAQGGRCVVYDHWSDQDVPCIEAQNFIRPAELCRVRYRCNQQSCVNDSEQATRERGSAGECGPFKGHRYLGKDLPEISTLVSLFSTDLEIRISDLIDQVFNN